VFPKSLRQQGVVHTRAAARFGPVPRLRNGIPELQMQSQVSYIAPCNLEQNALPRDKAALHPEKFAIGFIASPTIEAGSPAPEFDFHVRIRGVGSATGAEAFGRKHYHCERYNRSRRRSTTMSSKSWSEHEPAGPSSALE